MKKFELLPAVDIKQGRAVRLKQGVLSDKTIYGSPLECALDFQNAGASWLHLVDLDAAFGLGGNAQIVAEVINSLDIKVEVSGGIRDDATLNNALATNCERIILGTAALEDPMWTESVIQKYGNGGSGGGINVAGEKGFGSGAGVGGIFYSAGTLPSTGIFGSTATSVSPKAGDSIASSPNPGRTLPCPRGDYWYNVGYSACQDLGNIQLYIPTGSVVGNTAVISRGFKMGYGIRNNSGKGLNGGGNGGNGAAGGAGGLTAGGGGGSGYTDGSVTVISTQLGVNTGTGKVIIRSAV